MTKNKVPTLSDIATIAKVSKSTVSRALNDSPLISREMKELIQNIARQQNYQINASARQLSMRESRTIAFVTHGYHKDFSVIDLFTLEIMGGISKGLHLHGYDMLIIHVDPSDRGWARAYLDSGKAAGFILMTSEKKQDHIHELASIGAPFIIWGVQRDNLCCNSVCGDNVQGGRLATEYLIKNGRKQIGFIGGPQIESETQLRLQGYKNAILDAGMKVQDSKIAFGDYSPKSGSDAMNLLLQSIPDLDSVVVSSDLMAISAIDAIQNSGRTVPGDVAVIGYDDLSIARLSKPALTTISQNVPEAGNLMAKSIIDSIQKGYVSNVVFPVELVIRDSA